MQVVGPSMRLTLCKLIRLRWKLLNTWECNDDNNLTIIKLLTQQTKKTHLSALFAKIINFHHTDWYHTKTGVDYHQKFTATILCNLNSLHYMPKWNILLGSLTWSILAALHITSLIIVSNTCEDVLEQWGKSNVCVEQSNNVCPWER